MLREHARVGMKVIFGNQTGENTLGQIFKCNRVRAKVRILESRGQHSMGTTYNVPYEVMYPADNLTETKLPKLKYNPFNYVDNCLLLAMYSLYGELSPENLTCDGELSHFQVRNKAMMLKDKLNKIFTAFGRMVEEDEIYSWHREYCEYTKSQEKK